MSMLGVDTMNNYESLWYANYMLKVQEDSLDYEAMSSVMKERRSPKPQFKYTLFNSLKLTRDPASIRSTVASTAPYRPAFI